MPFSHHIRAFALAASGAILVLASAAPARPAADRVLPGGQPGPARCTAGQPGIRVAVTGLKDRTGTLRLELYPAVEGDFLKDDAVLLRAGKVFRRIAVAVPATGPIGLCIATPGPGRYAIVVVHDRHGAARFSIARDGVGVPGTAKIGRSRPTLAQAVVAVAGGISDVGTRMQYLRGFSGFGPERS